MSATRRRSLTLVALCVLGCHGVPSDAGSDARLRVRGGVFTRGAFPVDDGGPRVLGAYLTQTTLRPAQQNKSFYGVVEKTSSAVAVALAGDSGFWTVPVGLPPPESPDTLGFDAPFSLADTVAEGDHALLVWAIDEQGRAGPPSRTAFSVQSIEARAAFTVELRWDTASDLDLHVVLPDGVEIHAGDPVAGPGNPPRAYLDLDSNADCVIDARNRERVLFMAPPAPGRYQVRVETSSLCDERAARFTVEVRKGSLLVDRAEAIALPSDTRFAGERGAGLLITTFDVK